MKIYIMALGVTLKIIFMGGSLKIGGESFGGNLIHAAAIVFMQYAASECIAATNFIGNYAEFGLYYIELQRIT